MKLFCFASRNVENIRRGVEARKWAVAKVTDSAMRGRITKAKRYFSEGARGVIYCNQTQSFTTPFIATSGVDPDSVVIDIWPEPWVLPFSIEPLGGPCRQIHKDKAFERWSILIERLRDYNSITAAMNITGTTVFVPTDVPEEVWDIILDDLAC